MDAAMMKAVACLMLCLMAPWLAADVVRARQRRDEIARFHRQAEATLAEIPDSAAVVFIRYPATHDHDLSLVANAPDCRTERLWLVADRGSDNGRLLQLTNRTAYRLNTDTWTLDRLR